MAQVILNGDGTKIDDGMSLLGLIESRRLRPELIAVELNRKIVPRAQYSTVRLREGDEVEIVHVVGGGSF